MICPILSAARLITMFMNSGTIPGESLEDCNEENCAWWDVFLGVCAIQGINKELSGINDRLLQTE